MKTPIACPWCGRIPGTWVGGPTAGVECSNKECLVHPYVYTATLEEAIVAWNTRAAVEVTK